jgi:argininosuccinate lyase
MTEGSSKLWGGRFAAEPSSIFLDYSQSLEPDSRMAAEDVWGSQAHVLMLGKQGILTDQEARVILRCLEDARAHVEQGTLELDPADEDIHMNLEKHLTRGAGPDVGGKLHTARSRNDQVVTDSRLHLRSRLLDVCDRVADLQAALLEGAAGHERTVMPGYTHTQHAQPISVAFWLTGHVAALQRDHARLLAAFDRADACPLGACALAGTSFPTDRTIPQRLLGFSRVEEHALDAVGSRDVVIEALAALAILHANLSRLCEELVVFSTHEFRMIEIADEYASGSSIMPQKKNPCLAELARARTGEMYGRLMQALTMVKALLSGYNRDVQEDKPPLWAGLDLAERTLVAVSAMVRTMTLKPERMKQLASENFATATEFANWLVRDRGLPFRRCHEIVGGVVRQLVGEGRSLNDTTRVVELLAGYGVTARPAELGFLEPGACLEQQRSLGSTGPDAVSRMLAALTDHVGASRAGVASLRARIGAAREATDAAIRQVLGGGSVADLNL